MSGLTYRRLLGNCPRCGRPRGVGIDFLMLPHLGMPPYAWFWCAGSGKPFKPDSLRRASRRTPVSNAPLPKEAPDQDSSPTPLGVVLRRGKRGYVLPWSELVQHLEVLLRHSPQARLDVAQMLEATRAREQLVERS